MQDIVLEGGKRGQTRIMGRGKKVERGTADYADERRFYFGELTLAKIAKVAKKRK